MVSRSPFDSFYVMAGLVPAITSFPLYAAKTSPREFADPFSTPLISA